MEEEIKLEKCINCGCGYRIKSGMPDICWGCGAPTKEKICQELK
jgi:hypothetical protein